MGEAGHPKEGVGAKRKGGGFNMLDLFDALGIGLGVVGIKGINHDDRAHANLFPLAHDLAIYPARLDPAPGQPLRHQSTIRGDLSVPVVSDACLLIEPPAPAIRLGFDCPIFVGLRPRSFGGSDWAGGEGFHLRVVFGLGYLVNNNSIQSPSERPMRMPTIKTM
jgi:hypothetical protein